MILKPFTVTSKSKDYKFVDREALDSELLKRRVTTLADENIAFIQFEALCSQLGLSDNGAIPNIHFGVFDDADELVGTFMLGCIQYVFGPWADTADWVVTDPAAVAVFTARPMPGFWNFSPEDEDALATEAAVYLLRKTHRTGEDTPLRFSPLTWDIFKEHTDPISTRSKRLHAAAIKHQNLKITETVNPENRFQTMVEAEFE